MSRRVRAYLSLLPKSASLCAFSPIQIDKRVLCFFLPHAHVRCVSYGVKLLYLRAENTLFNRVRVSKLNQSIQSSVVGAGFACPKTQNKLFSGERTSPLRTKRQHYPRLDTSSETRQERCPFYTSSPSQQ